MHNPLNSPTDRPGHRRVAAAGGAALLSMAVAGVVVPASPADAYAKGCSLGMTNAKGSEWGTLSTSCIEVWGDGNRVDGLEQWFEIEALPYNPISPGFKGFIVYEMNFDYPNGHTDTLQSPMFAVDCSFGFWGVCRPNDDFVKHMNAGRFNWGDYRPDIKGWVGYHQICAKVKRKDGFITNSAGTLIGLKWTDVTDYKCFRIG